MSTSFEVIMKKKILDIILCLLLILIAYFGYNSYYEVRSYSLAKEKYSQLRSLAFSDTEEHSLSISEISDSLNVANLSELQEASPSACAWITIPDTIIDYPLVQWNDNTYFLTHDATGEDSKAGAIYLNCENSASMNDIKTIIYGHNLRDGSMFSQIHHYKDADFAQSHPLLYIYMYDGEIRTYHVFCVLSVDKLNQTVYSVNSNDTISSITDYLVSNADNVYANPTTGNILLLSTCIKGDSRRVVAFQELPLIQDETH